MTRETKIERGQLSGPRQWRFHDGRGGCALLVRVRPGSPKTGIYAIRHDTIIEILLQSDDDPWRCNQELVAYLSRLLGVPKSRIEIVAGLSTHGKMIAVEGISAEEATERLRRELQRNTSQASLNSRAGFPKT